MSSTKVSNERTSSDAVAELYKVPELASLGPIFRSTSIIDLTESETEYVVSYIKHVTNDHVILEFIITNTLSEQLLIDARDSQRVDSWQKKITLADLRCGYWRC